MYVWCDALTNYISALGYKEEGELYEKFWKGDEVVHVIGKDILRFHVVIWPAMLLAAGVPLPKKALVHGFITSQGKKMSKSLGNVVDPLEIVRKYGLDPFRYYLLNEIPMGKDGDFSYARFEELYNANLANNLGNLVNRVLSMIKRYEVDLSLQDDELRAEINKSWQAYHQHFEKFDLHLVCQEITKILMRGNQYIEQKKPWELAKQDQEALGKVLFNLYELLRATSSMLAPIMPETSEKLRQKLGLRELLIFSEEETWGSQKNPKLEVGEPLFPKLELG